MGVVIQHFIISWGTDRGGSHTYSTSSSAGGQTMGVVIQHFIIRGGGGQTMGVVIQHFIISWGTDRGGSHTALHHQGGRGTDHGGSHTALHHQLGDRPWGWSCSTSSSAGGQTMGVVMQHFIISWKTDHGVVMQHFIISWKTDHGGGHAALHHQLEDRPWGWSCSTSSSAGG